MGWVGISTHSFSGSTTDAQVTPSLCFQSLAHLELDTAHSAGVHSCLWEWASVFLALHRDTIHRFVPTCKMQQTSPQVTELLHWFLFVLIEPQPLLELCCQMDFGGTFDSPPTPNTNSQGRVVTGLETTAQSSCSGIGPASLLGNWKHQQLFSFFDFDFVKYVRK